MQASMVFVLTFATVFAPGPARGQELSWLREFGTDRQDSAVAIAADSRGVFVAGNTGGKLGTFSAGFDDGFMRRFDTMGNTVWTRQFGTANFDYPTGIALSGNLIYVAGRVVVTSQDVDSWIRIFSLDGTLVASTSISGTGHDEATAVASAGSDVVYVAGWTTSLLSFPEDQGGEDGFIQRYASGKLTWSVQLGTSADDRVTGAATYRSDVYVVGWTKGDLHGPNAGGSDAFVRRYNSSTGQWTLGIRYGTLDQDVATAVTVDPNGNIYVVGLSGGMGFQRGFIHRYANNGSVVWLRHIGGPNEFVPRAIASDHQGNTYVAGIDTTAGKHQPVVHRYSPAGVLVWTTRIDERGEWDLTGIANVGRDLYVSGESRYITSPYQDDYEAFAARLQQRSCWTTANPTGDERNGVVNREIHNVVEPAVGPLGVGDDVHNLNCTVIDPRGL